MTLLKNRLSKLESKLGVNVTIEDILKVLHDQKKGIACEAEWQRIKSSRAWKDIRHLIKRTGD